MNRNERAAMNWVIGVLVAFALALAIGALLTGCSSSKPKLTDDPLRAHILNRREHHIRRMAPEIGIPVDRALQTRVTQIYLCPEEGRSGDGSWACDKSCVQTPSCVHAWCSTSFGASTVEYLYITPLIEDGCIAHETLHELLVIFYGVTGHPASVTVNRIDNGKKITFRPANVADWRWPSIFGVTRDWGTDYRCGSELILMDGAGI